MLPISLNGIILILQPEFLNNLASLAASSAESLTESINTYSKVKPLL